jgi:hypothetical protein
MEVIMPSWLFNIIFIGYFVGLLVLTYILIRNKRFYNSGQLIVMFIVLWLIPIIGQIIVAIALRKGNYINKRAG